MLQTTQSILSLGTSSNFTFYPEIARSLRNMVDHRDKYLPATAPDRVPVLPAAYPEASLDLHYEDLLALATKPEAKVRHIQDRFIHKGVHMLC